MKSLNEISKDLYNRIDTIKKQSRTITQKGAPIALGQVKGVTTNQTLPNLNDNLKECELLLQDKIKILLLTGETQSGKTTFCQSLVNHLFEQEFVVIYLDLNQFQDVIHPFIENYLNDAFQCSPENIQELKQLTNIIFIFDHYGNKGVYPNLYVAQSLDQWRAKSIIVSNQSHLAKFKDYSPCFAPYIGQKRQTQLLNVYKLPVFIKNEHLLSKEKSSTESAAKDVSIRNPSISTKTQEDKSLSHIERLLRHPLNQLLLTADPNIMNLLADMVQADPSFKKFIYEFINGSRIEPRLTTAAANGLTSFKYNKELLNFIDLSNVKAKGVDLSNSQMNYANLEGADFSEGNLQGISLHKSNLANAYLPDVNFGENPYLEHDRDVSVFTYSNNGRFIASADNQIYKIYIWDAQTNTLLKHLEGHTSKIVKLQFDPQTNQLASVDDKNQIIIWQLNNYQQLCTLENDSAVSSITFDPEGKNIAVGSKQGQLSLWSIEARSLIKQFDVVGEKYKFPVNQLIYFPDSYLLIAACCEAVKIWTSSGEELVQNLGAHTTTVNKFAVSTDNKYLATADDHKICIWEIRKGFMTRPTFVERYMFSIPSGKIKDICFNSQSSYFSACTEEGIIHLWNMSNGQLFQTFMSKTHNPTVLTFDPFNNFLISGGQDHTLHLWDLHKKQLSHVLRGHTGEIKQLYFHPDSHLLFTQANDKYIRCWPMAKYLSPLSDDKNQAQLKFAAFNHKKNIIITVDFENVVRLQNLNSRRYFTASILFTKYTSYPIIGLSASANYLIFLAKSNEIQLGNTNTHNIEHTISLPEKIMTAIIDQEEKYLAIATEDGQLYLYDLTTKKINKKLTCSLRKIKKLYFSDDSQLLIASNDKGIFDLWNIHAEKSLIFSLSHKTELTAITSSKDNHLFATGSKDGVLNLWDVNNRQLSVNLHETNKEISALQFDPSGKFLAIIIKKYGFVIWDVEQKKIKYRHPVHKKLTCLAWHDSLPLLAIAGSAHEPIFIYNNQTQQIKKLISADKIIALKFSGENSLLTISYHNQITHWRSRQILDKQKWDIEWASHNLLFVKGCSIANTHGLSDSNIQLLKQRKANFYPIWPFQNEIYLNQREQIHQILITRDDIHAQFENQQTFLHFAAKIGDVIAIRILIEKGARINAKDVNGMTPLHHAAYSGHLFAVKILLQYKADINAQEKRGITILQAAICNSQIIIMQELLIHSLNINATDVRGWTALHWAARQGLTQAVNILVQKNADIHAICHVNQPYTALHIACEYGFNDIAEILLIAGAKIHGNFSGHISPLFCAVGEGHISTVKFMLNKGAKANAIIQSISLLHVAAKFGFTEIITILLQQPGVNIDHLNNDGATPLHWAIKHRQEDAAKLLLSNRANNKLLDEIGFTPLHLAIGYKLLGVAELLLKQKVDKEFAIEEYESTPLHTAAKEGFVDGIKLLLQHKVKIDPTARLGLTPLHMAVSNGHYAAVKLLCKEGANFNALSTRLHTPLFMAAMNNHIDILLFLISLQCEIDNATDEGITPLMIASLQGHVQAVKALLAARANPNLKADENITPLHMAARGGHLEIIRLLIAAGVDVNVKDDQGVTPLRWAVQLGYAGIAQELLEHGAQLDTNINVKNLHAMAHAPFQNIITSILTQNRTTGTATLLHLATEQGFSTIVYILIKHGADIEAKTSHGMTALHAAALKGQSDAMQVLLENNANIEAIDKDGLTPLQIGAREGHYNCVFLLLKFKAQINVQSSQGTSPLHLAVRYEHKHIVTLLLENHANINITSNEEELNPLTMPSGKYDVKEMLKLMFFNASAADDDNKNQTPLHWAAKYGLTEMIALLILHGADLKARDKSGAIPLHLAIKRNKLDAAIFLADKMDDVDILYDGKTALYIAAEEGHELLVKKLIKKGANKEFKGKANSTPLHCAAACGHKEVVRVLLDANAYIEAITTHLRTPLHAAAMQDQPEIIILLDEYDANLNAHADDSLTPLHMAAHSGNLKSVTALLSIGAKKESRDDMGRTALHIATFENRVDVVRELLKFKVNCNARTKEGITPLHLAVMKENQEIIDLLLEAKADVNVELENGISLVGLALKVGNKTTLKKLKEAEAELSADELRSLLMHQIFNSANSPKPKQLSTPTLPIQSNEDDEQFQEALKLSMEPIQKASDASSPQLTPQTENKDEDEDDLMRQALELSMGGSSDTAKGSENTPTPSLK